MSELVYHERYIKRCFDLAQSTGSAVRPNPNVGAVLVYNNKIIGEGRHEYFGGPHAEVNCMNSVKENDRKFIGKSTLYVSLEPCNYKGKTPACTDLILKNKIPRLVISSIDPNPIVDGSGLDHLGNQGVEIVQGILKKDGDELIRPFKINQLKKRPYIILKIVKSADNYIGKRGQKIWLSNQYSKILSHKWRSEVDGILVGTNTAITDDPGLDNRLFTGNSPVRIVLDRNNTIASGAKLKNDSQKTFIINSQIGETSGVNTHFTRMDFDSESFIEELCTKLFEEDIFVLLVEGGAKLIRSFLEMGLWDEARIISTKIKLGTGIPAPNIEGRLWKEEDIGGDKLLTVIREL